MDWRGAVEMVRQALERRFPLRCAGCAREFASLGDFVLTTAHVGPSVSKDLDGVPEATGEPHAYARCPCGKTITIDTSGMSLATRLELAWFARTEAKRRGVSVQRLLTDLHAEVEKVVLEGHVHTASPPNAPAAASAGFDTSEILGRHLRFTLVLGALLALLIVLGYSADGTRPYAGVAIWGLVLVGALLNRLLRHRPRSAAGVTVGVVAAALAGGLVHFGALPGAGLVLAILILFVAVEFGRRASIIASILGGLLIVGAGLVSRRIGTEAAPLPLMVWVRTACVSSGLSLFIGLSTSSLIGGLRTALANLAAAQKENERIHAQAARRRELETVGRLVGGVVHDVNNSLTVLSSCVEALADEAMPETARELVADLAEAVESTHGTMRGLLELVRSDPTEPSTCNPAATIERIVRNLRRLLPEDVELETALVEGYRVPLGRGPLVQAILNLVLNARDALDGPRAKKHINIAVEPSEDAVVIVVADNGRGMDPETALRAGEPLFTTKGAAGTGLGLSSVRSTVGGAGGRLVIDSVLDRGTEVRLVFPRVPDTSISVAQTQPSRLQGVRVLVVEDEDGIRRAFARALVAAGASVEEAGTVKAALAHLASDAPAPDILLCDGVLGDGTAADVVPRFAEKCPGAPALVVSGHDRSELIARGLVLTRDVEWVPKPLTGKDLTRHVGRALGLLGRT